MTFTRASRESQCLIPMEVAILSFGSTLMIHTNHISLRHVLGTRSEREKLRFSDVKGFGLLKKYRDFPSLFGWQLGTDCQRGTV